MGGEIEYAKNIFLERSQLANHSEIKKKSIRPETFSGSQMLKSAKLSLFTNSKYLLHFRKTFRRS